MKHNLHVDIQFWKVELYSIKYSQARHIPLKFVAEHFQK